jgi:1,2-dihydroxy-3-keto-5-methylthiopentene dioxygenase
MSRLRIFGDADPTTPLSTTEDLATIAERLRPIGVRFEQWAPFFAITPGDPP